MGAGVINTGDLVGEEDGRSPLAAAAEKAMQIQIKNTSDSNTLDIIECCISFNIEVVWAESVIKTKGSTR